MMCAICRDPCPHSCSACFTCISFLFPDGWLVLLCLFTWVTACIHITSSLEFPSTNVFAIALIRTLHSISNHTVCCLLVEWRISKGGGGGQRTLAKMLRGETVCFRLTFSLELLSHNIFAKVPSPYPLPRPKHGTEMKLKTGQSKHRRLLDPALLNQSQALLPERVIT